MTRWTAPVSGLLILPLLTHASVIAPLWTPEADLQPVHELISRVLPSAALPYFNVALNPSLSADGADTFSLSGGGASPVLVTGSSLSAVTTGLGWYLKYHANCSFAWSGSQMAVPLPPPAVSTAVTVAAALPWRYYLNTCTHSYSLAFWTWERWEREIDWMALQGINMPLAFTGQEAIWYDLFKMYNVTEAELDEWFTGPAFLAWWRMGNIRGYGGPLDSNWRDGQRALQLQILPRMRSLGMTTVLPGFAGHVPAGLARAFPKANITRSPAWAGFNETLSGDYLLDSSDPLFAELASTFTKLLVNNFGTDSVYNADTFNEMIPASNDTTYLKNLAADLYKSLSAADPNAIWMIQGWMFSFDGNFWQPEQIKAYLSGVPKGKMIILDLNAFLDPIWSKTESFYDTDFIWCIIDNAGGRPGIFGDLERVTTGPVNTSAYSTSLVGVGIAPEGIQQNPITYELMAEMGWRSESVELNTWVEQYARRRYGPNAPQEIYDAWAIMLPNLYNDINQHFFNMYADTPGLKMGGYSDWTNVTAMIEVWRLFHAAADDLSGVPTFEWDYIDVTRQAVGYIFEDVYIQLIAAFNTKNVDGINTMGKVMTEMIDDIDAVLGTNSMWMVGSWLNDARGWGSTEAQSDQYELTARRLITTWGNAGMLNGYATRELAGLNTDYHGKQWTLFVERLAESVTTNTTFDANKFSSDCFYDIELPWTNAHNPYPSKPMSADGYNTVSVIDRVFKKYAGQNDAHSLSYHYRIHPNSDGEGGLWSNMRMQIHDPSVGEFLCNVNPDCGGFVHDGYYKPLYAQPVPYNGSTYYRKVESTCKKIDCSAAITGGATECNNRCDCFWDPSKDTCGCVGLPDHPACELHYPAPDNTSLVNLGNPSVSPLKPNDRISVFGDSITWLGGYIELLRDTVASSGTDLSNVTFFNRGINGGMVKDIRDGGELFKYNYSSFAQVLAEDKPTVVTIMIGVNDVWFPSSSHHSDPDPFKLILGGLVSSARAAGATVLLSTLTVHGELTTGTQYFDKNMTLYSNLIMDVANETGCPYAPMHKRWEAYEKAYNNVPEGGIAQGVLTYAGVHPCWGGDPTSPCPKDTHGNLLIANTLSEGLLTALGARNEYDP